MSSLAEAAPAHRSRHLDWEGCRNLRDLGGLATEGGGTTAWGAFVRGDTLCDLTETGRGAVLGYGIRTVVDLRSAGEITSAPNPFAALPDVISYIHHPLNDLATAQRIEGMETAAERYVEMVSAGGRRLAAIFTSFAQAPEGGILFHCYAGRDRTGIVAALLLRLAGVPVEAIVEDYEVTDSRMRARYDEWLTTFVEPGRSRFLSSLEERGHPIRATIEHVEERYGSVRSYLEEHGTARSDTGRLVARISGGEASG